MERHYHYHIRVVEGRWIMNRMVPLWMIVHDVLLTAVRNAKHAANLRGTWVTTIKKEPTHSAEMSPENIWISGGSIKVIQDVQNCSLALRELERRLDCQSSSGACKETTPVVFKLLAQPWVSLSVCQENTWHYLNEGAISRRKLAGRQMEGCQNTGRFIARRTPLKNLVFSGSHIKRFQFRK